METLSPAQIAAFEAVLNKVQVDDRARLHAIKDAAAAAAAASAPHWDFDQPGHRAEEALREAFGAA
ncbi:MAG: hypothetical protein Q8M32_12000, partial [Brevundimonas sp.]|nr:hypothetical protein [Brevundimonas sp.]